MVQHRFLFSPGIWLGEGKVHVSHSSEILKFFTRWTVEPANAEGVIDSLQEVEISGLSEMMNNHFLITAVDTENFQIELQNQNLGRIVGSGLIRAKTVSWEFRSKEVGFEGFEFYQFQNDNAYFLRAEYASHDDFWTAIEGNIWKQSQAPL